MEQFEIFNDVFDRETFVRIGKDIMGPNWQYGHGSKYYQGKDPARL